VTNHHSLPRGVRLPRAMVAFLALSLLAIPALASSHAPSTNDANRTNGWAHVNEVDVGLGEITLEFVSTRSFASCFEFRSDGDTSQKIGEDNYNAEVDDGLYPFVCVNNSTDIRTLYADSYVEVRMVFGAERDERFDWTRFDVLSDAQAREDCMDGGWEAYGFRNQGQCIRFVNGGGDSR
jgi:hypothetical protein